MTKKNVLYDGKLLFIYEGERMTGIGQTFIYEFNNYKIYDITENSIFLLKHDEYRNQKINQILNG